MTQEITDMGKEITLEVHRNMNDLMSMFAKAANSGILANKDVKERYASVLQPMALAF